LIRGFRHRGLQRLYECDDSRGLNAAHVDKIRRILARLEIASVPADMNLPGWRLHRLKGNRAGFWSVTVQANWRVIFRFEKGNATDVDYLDYH
jgi:toxin HigB-1